MAGRQITLNCDHELGQTLTTAIRLYAEAAYPPGGSECAQVARETLLDAATAIDEQFAARGSADVSRRLRSQLYAALDYYVDVEASQGNDITGRVLQLQAAIRGKTE